MTLKTIRETIGVIRGEVEVYGNPSHVDGRRFTEDDRHRATSRARYRTDTLQTVDTRCAPSWAVLLACTTTSLQNNYIFYILYCVRNIGLFIHGYGFSQGRSRAVNFNHFFNLNIVKICFGPSTIANQSWDAPQVYSRTTDRELRIFKQRVFFTIIAIIVKTVTLTLYTFLESSEKYPSTREG